MVMLKVPLEAVVFMGIFLGVFLRTFLPWLRKLSQGKIENFHFDRKYLTTMFFALLSSFGTTMVIYGCYTPPEGSWLSVLLSSILFGWGWNDVYNQGIKFWRRLWEQVKKYVDEALPPESEVQEE
ncbi:MAG: hypothetical protein DRG31_02390 [Deltaproteobacteria bacterium]|nr:MAG: hypothetical protein DRG31_02390 [Deltaproteobacteria bacterium]